MTAEEKGLTAAASQAREGRPHVVEPSADCPGGAACTQPEQRLLPEAHRKWFATARAEGARRGIAVDLIEGDDGRAEIILSRWAWTRSVRTLEELAGLLRVMGVQLASPPGTHG